MNPRDRMGTILAEGATLGAIVAWIVAAILCPG